MDQQKGPGSRLSENILPILAVVVLVLALVFAKGAVFALRPLLKFAIPAAIAYVSWRWVKRKFMMIAGNTIRQKMEDAMRGQMGGPQGGAHSSHQVIDLCPKCGAYLAPGHRCS